MNFLNKLSKLALVALVMVGFAACQGEQKGEKAPESANMPKQANENMTVRYVDADTLLKFYNLAKDYNESATRMQNQLDALQKAQEDKIRNLQASFAQKERTMCTLPTLNKHKPTKLLTKTLCLPHKRLWLTSKRK